ncbi:cation-translocating P-type ATPase [Cellulomonas soli]|uniref:cation-translocating P-type ATPase n=1 Tax=Cellulomonas soli TaxID=931535 RepID=UPI003F877E5E
MAVTEAHGSAPFAQPPDVVLDALSASAEGLTGAEASRRLAQVGPNRLPEPPRTHPVLRFLRHFQDVLIYILLAAAVLKAVLGDWVDFAVIVAVAVANAVVGFVQEGRADKALAGIATMLSLDAQVRRDGAWHVVAADDLVPGDVVRVRSGDRVPADVRLLETTTLQVDEAALTGESVPAGKDVEAVGPDAGVGDRSSMLFSGTIVTSGRGTGVVTATGGGTEIGRIQQLVAEVDPLDTPLTRQLARLGSQLSLLILVMAVVMLVIGRLVHGFEGAELISAAIGFAVAAVPEGLPALVTITLALGVQQMARRNAITRRLTSVEALGSVTTICSDKTGTLTRNEMTVRTVITPETVYDVDGLGYEPTGEVRARGAQGRTDACVGVDAHADGHSSTDRADLRALVAAGVYCNDARLTRVEGRWQIVGQPTEGAVVVLAEKVGYVAEAQRLAHVPFESSTKFAATLDALPDGTRTVHVLGAPDRLLDRCTTQRTDHGPAPVDIDRWEAAIDLLGGQGLRVLAAARRAAADEDALTDDTVGEGLELLGLFGILDPPRPEAVAAITDCHRAGIRVKMITGDHAGTALAIAKELGIVGPGQLRQAGAPEVVTGSQLEAMSDDELRACVRDVDVYARTSPEHKIRIVRALQSHGEVVAMTGDGVNDAPALTRADVGIAMGIKGTEATKEAADIVLADDDFATIEQAVEEGRRIYDNIRKSVAFLLPTNGAQSLVILVAVLLGLTLPLTPVQILWVNLVTAVTLSLALSGEPAEPDIMRRPPRAPDEHVVSPRSLLLILFASVAIGTATLVVFLVEKDQLGAPDATAQTAAVTVLAAAQLGYLFSCRLLGSTSLTWRVLVGNRLVWVAAAALLVLQLVFTYAPFMHDWFGSAPIGWRDWGLAVLGGAVVFLLNEAAKAVGRRVLRS